MTPEAARRRSPTSWLAATALPSRAARLPGWLLPAVAFGAIVTRRWLQMGPYVTGVDGGSWYALGRGLLGGPGKSTAAAFPPIVPVAMHLGRLVADEMLVARVMAFLSLLLVILAVYYVIRGSVRPVVAVTVGMTVGLSAYLNEVAAFGGYPQNLATALLVVGVFAEARYLETGRRRDLVVVTVALALAALTHHAYLAIVGATAAVGWAIWLTTPRPRDWMARSLWLGVPSAAAALCFLPTWLALVAAGYAPPLNLATLSFEGRFVYNTSEAPWIWVFILLFGLLYLAFTPGRRTEATWRVAVAAAATGLVAYLVSGELRVFPPLLIGATLGFGLAMDELLDAAGSGPWRLPAAALLVALLAALWIRTDARLTQWYDYYAVADPRLLRAAAWVDEHRSEGAVAVHAVRDGWPLGWWFEGLSRAPIVTDADPRLLAFPAERANSALAEALFDPLTPAPEIVARARAAGIRYFVFDERDWPEASAWRRSLGTSIRVVFDDQGFMIVELPPAS